MPNRHKLIFEDLYIRKKQENYVFFTDISVTLENNSRFLCLECNIDEDILEVAIKLAQEKSKFTMDANQAGIHREQIVKIQKSGQGIMAEMFLHFLFIERYNLDIIRYDLERDTFDYSTEEYDLMIISEDKQFEIESRSSNIRRKSLREFIQNDVIIGPYGNRVKSMDSFADFHFRPVYIQEFLPPLFDSDGDFIIDSRMIDKTNRLFITGCATKDEMIEKSFKGSLGQYGTTYHLIKVISVGDVVEMDEKISKAIKRRVFR
jgi:hypothetical protein